MWDMLMNTGVFAVLFGWLFYDTRKEAKNREDRLMNHIEKQGEALDRITDTMEKMDVRLTHIEGKVNKSE
ncbi:holin [Bacillus subtilis]|nr:holin [Bacillus subtilis]